MTLELAVALIEFAGYIVAFAGAILAASIGAWSVITQNPPPRAWFGAGLATFAIGVALVIAVVILVPKSPPVSAQPIGPSGTTTITPTPTGPVTSTPEPATATLVASATDTRQPLPTSTEIPPTSSPQPTDTPIPPSPTDTPIPPSPTDTPVPPTPTDTPPAETKPGTILEVGQSWKQGGLELVLESADVYVSWGGGGPGALVNYRLTSHKSSGVVLNLSKQNFSATDNLNQKLKVLGAARYYDRVFDINESTFSLKTNEYTEFLQYIQFDVPNPTLTEVTVTVTDIGVSGIKNARWRFNNLEH